MGRRSFPSMRWVVGKTVPKGNDTITRVVGPDTQGDLVTDFQINGVNDFKAAES